MNPDRLRIPLSFFASLMTALVAAIAIVWGVAQMGAHNRLDDPDHLYHLSIAREYARQGRLESLPQIDQLSWSKKYEDKEWLFHRTLGLGFRLGGERGAETTAHLLAWAMLVCLGLCSRRDPILFKRDPIPFEKDRIPPHLLSLGLLILCPTFLVRITGVRPHQWGQLCTVVILLGALMVSKTERKKLGSFLLALGALAWPLGYTTPFLAAPLFGILILASLKDRALARATLLGLGAWTLGHILHPDFPGVLWSAFSNLRIATSTDQWAAMASGQELISPPIQEWLLRYGAHLSVIVIAGAHWGLRALGASSQERRQETLGDLRFWIWILACFWTLVSLKNHRAIEYSIPLTALVALGAIDWSRKLKIALAISALLLLIKIPDLARPPLGTREPRLSAVQALPAGTYKVYNCSWGLGPYLLYGRPELKFVDALDPVWLAAEDPARAELKSALLAGRVREVAKMVKEVFGSETIFCEDPDLGRYLQTDPVESKRWRWLSGEPNGGPWIVQAL